MLYYDNATIDVSGAHQCPDCRQKFDSEKARSPPSAVCCERGFHCLHWLHCQQPCWSSTLCLASGGILINQPHSNHFRLPWEWIEQNSCQDLWHGLWVVSRCALDRIEPDYHLQLRHTNSDKHFDSASLRQHFIMRVYRSLWLKLWLE